MELFCSTMELFLIGKRFIKTENVFLILIRMTKKKKYEKKHRHVFQISI